MKKILIFAVLFLIAFQTGIGVSAASEDIDSNNINLYPFEYKEKWGYMDKKGNITIEPKYDRACQFSDDLALVSKIKGKDELGYDVNKYGFINIEGEEVVPIRYDGATSFSNGNAVIVKYGSISYHKEFTVQEAYRYWIKPNGKYFLKEPAGKIIGALGADVSAYPFSNGLALVASGGAGETHYIDTKGSTVFETSYEGYGYTVGSDFSEGFAVICTGALEEGSKFGYINTNNKIIISPKYDDAAYFSEGLAPVRVGEKWGYIDKTDDIKIPMQYENANSFSEEIAAVKKDGVWGFIDKKGNIVIKPKYKNVEDMQGGLIMVNDETGKFLYYIDIKENIIKPKVK